MEQMKNTANESTSTYGGQRRAYLSERLNGYRLFSFCYVHLNSTFLNNRRTTIGSKILNKLRTVTDAKWMCMVTEQVRAEPRGLVEKWIIAIKNCYHNMTHGWCSIGTVIVHIHRVIIIESLNGITIFMNIIQLVEPSNGPTIDDSMYLCMPINATTDDRYYSL